MMRDNVKLSPNFFLHEFLRSNTAERIPHLMEQQFNPPDDVVRDLSYLVTKTLQPIRDGVDHRIDVSSGWRCWELNEKVGGASNSQHLFGQAADISASSLFFNDRDAKTQRFRNDVQQKVSIVTGQQLRPDVNASFYLFAWIALHIEELDVDQVIHEYGTGFGQPAWIHVSSSLHRNSREILAIGRYTPTLKVDVDEALTWGV